MTDPKGPSAPNPDELTELSHAEGGRWNVYAQGSVHRFDLDAGTVTRIPGPNSRPSINDVTRKLRTIEASAVGRSGYWTLASDRDDVDFYWQVTSRIVRITRIPDDISNTDE